MKKSVSFADLREAQLEYGGDLELSDSRHGSDVHDDDDGPDRRWSGGGGGGVEAAARTRDAAVNTRTGLPSRPRTASPQRPAWRYWNNDPSPSLHEPLHHGPYREGPYRDCVDSIAQILLRDANKSDYNTGRLHTIFDC